MKIGINEIRRVPREVYERYSVWVEPTGMTRDSERPLLGSSNTVTVACFWYPFDAEREREALAALQPYFPGERLVAYIVGVADMESQFRYFLDRTYAETPAKPTVAATSPRTCAFCGAGGSTSDLYGGKSAYVCVRCAQELAPGAPSSESQMCSFCGKTSNKFARSSLSATIACDGCLEFWDEVRSLR